MILALSGPSGIGKGFVRQHLLQMFPLINELPWVTTRPPRPMETTLHRIHVSHDEFDRLVGSGELVLVQRLYDNKYGLRRSDFLHHDGCVYTEIHPGNIVEARQSHPGLIIIGLITRDFDLLRERLTVTRKTEQSTEIDRRIMDARQEVDLMFQHRSAYTALIEVCRETEATIFEQVLAVLDPWFIKKVRTHVP